jgi:hydroxymethylpyrimidine pyrophosphatase-like HAD family hydrolase
LGDRLREACAGLAQVLVTDQGRTIQVIPQEAGKLQAVERIRQQLGLSVEEVSVFGDDLNDLEMIANYPHSVAMGNGVEAVKAAAGFVTATNQENGIARGIDVLLP